MHIPFPMFVDRKQAAVVNRKPVHLTPLPHLVVAHLNVRAVMSKPAKSQSIARVSQYN